MLSNIDIDALVVTAVELWEHSDDAEEYLSELQLAALGRAQAWTEAGCPVEDPRRPDEKTAQMKAVANSLINVIEKLDDDRVRCRAALRQILGLTETGHHRPGRAPGPRHRPQGLAGVGRFA